MSHSATRIHTYLAREYRRLRKPRPLEIIFMVLCFLSVVAVYLLLCDRITDWLSGITAALLGGVTGEKATLLSSDFLLTGHPIYYVGLPNYTPSFQMALGCAIFCVILMLLMGFSRDRYKPLKLYLMISLFILLLSALFFIFWPDSYPYSISQYSEFYIKEQICIWIIIPSISAFSLSMFSRGGWRKYVAFFAITLDSFLFGCIRYMVYLFVMLKCSSMFTATLLFSVGLIFDLLQMITIYALYISRTCMRLESYGVESGREVWQ